MEIYRPDDIGDIDRFANFSLCKCPVLNNEAIQTNVSKRAAGSPNLMVERGRVRSEHVLAFFVVAISGSTLQVIASFGTGVPGELSYDGNWNYEVEGFLGR